jgi:hypothetical protein
MTEFFGLNLAVPSTAILKFDDNNKLAFDTNSWMHLLRYVGKVENLSVEFNGVSVDTGEALTKLRSECESFGSPKALRQLLIKNPNILADKTCPSMPYATIVWLVQHLHESALSTVSLLQSLLEGRSGNELKAGLQELGTNAGKAMKPISDLSVLLSVFKNEIIAANNTLSNAYKADTDLLHRKQERVGALQVRIEGAQKKIDELGFFSSKQKRTELEQELCALQQELASIETQSEKLRSSVGELESILEDGAWLKSSLDDLLGFFDNLRKVWTTFGSGLTQMAADASDAQLGDLSFVKKALGFDEAIKQWNAIDQAAKRFTVGALVDIPIP